MTTIRLYDPRPKTQIKPVLEGRKNATLIAALYAKPRTIPALMKLLGWSHGSVKSALREDVFVRAGYGLTRDDNDRYGLVLPRGLKQPLIARVT